MSEIKLPADSGGGSVSLKGPATTTGNAAVPFVLPVADGSAGQFIKTDGSKNLSFSGGGKILQVVSQNLTTQMTSSSDSAYVDTGLTASITPSATSSKVLVIVNVSFALNGDNNAYLQLVRGSTVINSGSGGSNNAWTAINANATAFRYSAAQQACNYLDSPSTTSATTYKVQTKVANSNTTLSINRRPDDTEFGTTSNITLMEVAA